MSDYMFNISLSVLNHLGRNLYRNYITVIGEALSNSWDADASNVWIYIDEGKKSLLIQDDGEGMSSSDFQNKFLTIGYSKRKDGNASTQKNRPFIGRKGIGKLALLSCAQKIHIVSKTASTEYIGGTIDNTGLDDAIKDDLTVGEYKLGDIDIDKLRTHMKQVPQGTAILFENIHDGIQNRITYIRKLLSIYFRFSLIDDSFNIHLNDDLITLDELDDFSKHTQFVWDINRLDDPYLKNKIDILKENIKKHELIISDFSMKGFIASVEKPSQLKIRGTDERVTVDLFVNGRLREKDILKHIPTTRIVESYLYGQIHVDILDDDTDRFTSNREGVLSDDPLFQGLLAELREKIIRQIIDEWDKFRVEINQDGDAENTKRLTRKRRKAKELFDEATNEIVPSKTSPQRSIVDEWIKDFSEDAQFNFPAYADCFISENLLRQYVHHNQISISQEAKDEIKIRKSNESTAKGNANLSISIRKDDDDLLYLSMDYLANLVDKANDKIKDAALSRDAVEYKPIRDAVAHTSLITDDAKKRLNTNFDNIRARVKTILGQ
jgi:hypothetical protein